MSEETHKKDYSLYYIALIAIIAVSVLLTVKSSETDKFAPIKDQLSEENHLMNIRVLNNYGEN